MGETADSGVDNDVYKVLRGYYHVVYPILIAVALVTNLACLLVTCRAKMRTLHVNKYIQMMSILDGLVFIVLLPKCFDTEFCVYSSYGFAFYNTYIDSLGYIFNTCSRYTLVALSLDRFMVVWCESKYQTWTRGSMKRLLSIFIWIAISYLVPICVTHPVKASEDGWLAQEFDKNHTHYWLGYYKYYLLVTMGMLPSAGLLTLTIGLVVGIIKKVVRNDLSNRQNTLYSQCIAVIVLSVSYVVAVIPYSIVIANHNIKSGKCYSDAETENISHLFLCLILLWSTLNIVVFFLLNRDY
ncbi:unnamed protein product, partial [Meganyctiphanes norvegica]